MFHFGWFTVPFFLTELILKLQLNSKQLQFGWKTDSYFLEVNYTLWPFFAFPPPSTPNILLPTKPPASFSTQILTFFYPLFTLHAPQCFVKIANTCFRKGYFNMPGNSASGWDTCWASVGSCSLGSSTSHWSVLYLYINMTVGQPHQEISAFCLFTSSIHPSLFFCIYRPWMIQVYFSLYALSPKKSTFQFCLRPSWHSSKRKIQN